MEANSEIKRILIASSTGESALKLYGSLNGFDVERYKFPSGIKDFGDMVKFKKKL